MTRITLTRLYDRYSDAVETVQALEQSGVPHSDISLLGPDQDRVNSDLGPERHGVNHRHDSHAESGVGAGATVGTVLGGGAGLLAGIGALAIPGIGPVVAAGWLVATLAGAGIGAGVGAAAGGLIGSMTDAGVDPEDANLYAEALRRGGSLVTVRLPDSTRAAEAEKILDHRGPIDADARRAEYRNAGWTGFDETDPYVADGTLPPPGRTHIP